MIQTTLSPADLKEWQIYSYTKRIAEEKDPVKLARLKHDLERINAADEFDKSRAVADKNLSISFRNHQNSKP